MLMIKFNSEKYILTLDGIKIQFCSKYKLSRTYYVFQRNIIFPTTSDRDLIDKLQYKCQTKQKQHSVHGREYVYNKIYC